MVLEAGAKLSAELADVTICLHFRTRHYGCVPEVAILVKHALGPLPFGLDCWSLPDQKDSGTGWAGSDPAPQGGSTGQRRDRCTGRQPYRAGSMGPTAGPSTQLGRLPGQAYGAR